MRFTLVSLVLIAGVAAALAHAQVSGDTPYEPAVPPPSVITPSGWYGGGGYVGGGGGTVAGSALTGMANAISAAGDYNLATSAAAVNLTQAQRAEIENRQLWTNTYFAMRETNRAARAATAKPKPTMEQIVRQAAQGVPSPLSPSEYDQVSGTVQWPKLLQSDAFASQRGAVEGLLAQRASTGTLGFTEQSELESAVDSMVDALQSQIRDVPSTDYIASRKFLKSLVATVSTK